MECKSFSCTRGQGPSRCGFQSVLGYRRGERLGEKWMPLGWIWHLEQPRVSSVHQSGGEFWNGRIIRRTLEALLAAVRVSVSIDPCPQELLQPVIFSQNHESMYGHLPLEEELSR